MQHMVHSSSWEYVIPLWKAYSWILLSCYSQYMVRIIFFAFIDYLTQYLHSLTISIQCIAPQEGKPLFGLHGQFSANIYDEDSHTLYGFGQVLYYFLYSQLIYKSIYILLVDVMTYTTSSLLRNNLPCYFLKQQLEKIHCDYLGDCWYFPAS